MTVSRSSRVNALTFLIRMANDVVNHSTKGSPEDRMAVAAVIDDAKHCIVDEATSAADLELVAIEIQRRLEVFL